jgi:hypothetical protein
MTTGPFRPIPTNWIRSSVIAFVSAVTSVAAGQDQPQPAPQQPAPQQYAQPQYPQQPQQPYQQQPQQYAQPQYPQQPQQPYQQQPQQYAQPQYPQQPQQPYQQQPQQPVYVILQPAPPPEPKAPPLKQRMELSAFSESSFGLDQAGFYNHLVGVRFGYRVSRGILLGGAVSYANLKGPVDRVSNSVLAAIGEWRIALGPSTSMPIRVYLGYLPNNGPWLKAALALRQDFGEHWAVAIEGGPVLWSVHNGSTISMDAALELTYKP